MSNPRLAAYVDVQFSRNGSVKKSSGIEGCNHFVHGNKIPRTESEKILNQALQTHGINVIPQYKFIFNGTLIVDFAIPKHKIAIECDSKAHHTKKQKAKDAERDRVLWSYGWRVIRLPDKRIMEDVEECIAIIKDEMDSWA